MSGQRKPPQTKAAPVKESQPPACINCKYVEVDSADRAFCHIKLPAFLPRDHYKLTRPDYLCDLYKAK